MSRHSAGRGSGCTTADATIVPVPGHEGLYRCLETALGEPYSVRGVTGHTEHVAHDVDRNVDRLFEVEPLLAFVHLTDLHVTDAQSPARAEFLDRLGNIDSALFPVLGNIGTYRPQDMLSMQVVEAMAVAVRNLHYGPATGCPVSFAMITGDVVDNSQYNEIKWYLDLMNGGKTIIPDSGDRSRYEGVGSTAFYDWYYWHPDGPRVAHGSPIEAGSDIAHERFGYPDVPGLLDSCRREFTSTGLGIPWYDVPGNHDYMLAGTIPHTDILRRVAVGDRKMTGWTEGIDMGKLLANHSIVPPDIVAALSGGTWEQVTADPDRRLIDQKQWLVALRHGIAAIDGESYGQDSGHGDNEHADYKSTGHIDGHSGKTSNDMIQRPALESGHSYYSFDAGPVRCLVLDTVNPSGGWQGSLDAEQLSWIEGELLNGHSRWLNEDGKWATSSHEDRLFVLFSHHPLETLVNSHSPSNSNRILAGDLDGLLGRFPNVILWVNGHTHRHKITLLSSAGPVHGNGETCNTREAVPEYPGHRIWQITTASLIDWPQQGRVIELAIDRSSRELVIYSTVLDHTGMIDPRTGDLDDPLVLAGWSRELALNSWHRDDPTGEPPGRGSRYDRNVILRIPAPFAL